MARWAVGAAMSALATWPSAAAAMDVVDVFGWSSDGVWFAYAIEETSFVDHGEGPRVAERARLAVVVNARTGDEVTYLLGVRVLAPGSREVRDRTASLPDRRTYETWAAKNVVVDRPSATSPSGNATASFRIGGRDVSWDGTFPYFQATSSKGTSYVELRVRDRDGLERVERSQWTATAWGDRTWSGRISWSPRGDRYAWIVDADPVSGPEGVIPPNDKVVLGAAGPSIEVLAAAVDDKAALRTIEALERDGYGPRLVVAPAAYSVETVVRAAPGYEAAAGRIAQSVPGGAALKALASTAGDNVVVQLARAAPEGAEEAPLSPPVAPGSTSTVPTEIVRPADIDLDDLPEQE